VGDSVPEMGKLKHDSPGTSNRAGKCERKKTSEMNTRIHFREGNGSEKTRCIRKKEVEKLGFPLQKKARATSQRPLSWVVWVADKTQKINAAGSISYVPAPSP